MVKALDLKVSPARVEGRNNAVEAYRALQEALTVGQFPAGTRLPGERTLAADLGVSRATLRAVLSALAEAGRIVPSPQRGWFVAENRLVHEPNRLRGLSEVARERGMEATSRVMKATVRPATLAEAEVLGIGTDAPVVDLRRVRLLDGSPLSIDQSCLDAARVPGLEDVDFAGLSLYDVLRDRYDIAASRCDYELAAEAVKAREAKLLGLAAGDPVLVGYQRTFDQHDQCFDVGRQLYRGDSYRFQASLFRF
ncbi:GntR family transcriptional regulator [Dactylosporangium sp. CS-033363]|uniref:GntR family transcriptional regulator n=1 Tax=Dactylosporangium sp. CS-033363 TaxID=3239935 RepID=UPI003D8C3FD3